MNPTTSPFDQIKANASAPAVPPSPSTQSPSGLPPADILMKLASDVENLDPMVLGTIIFHALSQMNLPINEQGIAALNAHAPAHPPAPPEQEDPTGGPSGMSMPPGVMGS